MNNEELADTGLSAGDRVRLTVEGTLHEIEFPSGCVLIDLDDDGGELGIGSSDIFLMEWARPRLLDGWTWAENDTCDGAIACAWGPGRLLARIDKRGGIRTFRHTEGVCPNEAATPAPIAEALAEVWKRTR